MKQFIILCICVLFLTSCSQRYYKYLQDENEFFDGEVQSEFSNQPPDYKIKPFDIIYIRISTNNEELNKLFNNNNLQLNINNYSDENSRYSYLFDYIVSDSGYIHVPILGNFKISEKTLYEVQQEVQQKTDFYLKNTLTVVKLISFKVTFLGEVSHQGTRIFYKDRITLLEAIAENGGLSDYADKRNVMIVRPTQKGSRVYRVDLTDRKILESQNLYLQPNDLVIVDPIKYKMTNMNISVLTTYITAITSSLTALFLVRSLFN